MMKGGAGNDDCPLEGVRWPAGCLAFSRRTSL
jgi:hypothetical protein